MAKRLVPSKTMPERDRRKQIRRTLDRLQAPVGTAPRDSSARQRSAYQLRRLTEAGDRLQAVHEQAGVSVVPKVGENITAQRAVAGGSPGRAPDPDAALRRIEAEIEFLAAYEAAIRADRTADVLQLQVPRGCFPAADDALLAELHRRVNALAELVEEIQARRDSKLVKAVGKLRQAAYGGGSALPLGTYPSAA